MASSINAQNSLSESLTSISNQTLGSEAQERLSSAQKLSVTPATQADAAVLLSLSASTSSTPDLGLNSLVYNASAAVSGTSDQTLVNSFSTEAKVATLLEES